MESPGPVASPGAGAAGRNIRVYVRLRPLNAAEAADAAVSPARRPPAGSPAAHPPARPPGAAPAPSCRIVDGRTVAMHDDDFAYAFGACPCAAPPPARALWRRGPERRCFGGLACAGCVLTGDAGGRRGV